MTNHTLRAPMKPTVAKQRPRHKYNTFKRWPRNGTGYVIGLSQCVNKLKIKPIPSEMMHRAAKISVPVLKATYHSQKIIPRQVLMKPEVSTLS